MKHVHAYPKSFPNTQETIFLKMALCTDEMFISLFSHWKEQVVFDDIDYATSRLLPFIYLRLVSAGVACDDVITQKIKGLYRLAWVHNQRLLHAMQQVVTLLESRGIEVLTLKGIPLLLHVYKDVGARFLGDADILVHPRYAKQVVACMLASGWRFQEKRIIQHKFFSAESLPRVFKEVSLINAQHVEMDIHWRIFESTGMAGEIDMASYDALASAAMPIVYNNMTYHTISPEDMLLHVIVHGAEGNTNRTLRWVVDAVMIWRTGTVHWEAFFNRTQLCGRQVEVSIAFSFLLEHGFVQLSPEQKQLLDTLVLSKYQIRSYYTSANATMPFFGSFPRLWRTYWQYESTRFFLFDFFGFWIYLAHAWGFVRVRDLVPFVIKKYLEKIRRFFHI